MKRGNCFRNQGLPNLVKVENNQGMVILPQVEIGVGNFSESDGYHKNYVIRYKDENSAPIWGCLFWHYLKF